MNDNQLTGKISKFRKLAPWQIDLAIIWKRNEGLTFPEIIDRMVSLFGEDAKITPNGLKKRIMRREANWKSGKVRGRIFEDANKIDDSSLLDWMRSELYLRVYLAAAANNFSEITRGADTLLKVMRAKKELLQSDESEEDKKINEMLKAFQQVTKENDEGAKEFLN